MLTGRDVVPAVHGRRRRHAAVNRIARRRPNDCKRDGGGGKDEEGEDEEQEDEEMEEEEVVG